MKDKLKYVVTIFFIVLVSAGCGKKSDVGAPLVGAQDRAGTRPAPTAMIINPAENGSLTGRVLFEGDAPAPTEISIAGNPECSVMHPGGKVFSEELLVDNPSTGSGQGGGLANAFVYIKEGLGAMSFPVPAASVTIANKGCVYSPHVSGVQVGQSVLLLNEDPTLHNIHSYSTKSRAWNLGLPFQGMKVLKKFDTPEVMVQLKCDVHPWMVGYVGVLPHPYFAVSRHDGSFEIKNLPPGRYTVEVWHEKLGVLTQKISVGANEQKAIEFKY